MTLNLTYQESIKKYIFPHGIYILLIITGYFAGNYLSNKNTDPALTSESRLKSNYHFVNPLLECDNTSISQLTNLDKLKNILEKQINDGGDQTSIYFRDMNNGPWFGINEKELFSPASLIKVPLMIAYLKKAESDPTILDKKILNTTVYDPRTQNIQPKVTLAPNKEYSIKELIFQMIKYSDDVSYDLLNKQITFREVLNVYNDLGVDISKSASDPAGNIVSVKSYSSFFRILFNASYLSPEMSEYALNILSQSQFENGLVGGLPKDIPVAHKFGERQYLDTGLKQLHDCGIVYLPNKPYLLCVMTKGNDFDTLETTIKTVSQDVYNYLSNN